MVSALTTNRQTILPRAAPFRASADCRAAYRCWHGPRRGGRVRLWSADARAGEEAYSLARRGCRVGAGGAESGRSKSWQRTSTRSCSNTPSPAATPRSTGVPPDLRRWFEHSRDRGWEVAPAFNRCADKATQPDPAVAAPRAVRRRPVPERRDILRFGTQHQLWGRVCRRHSSRWHALHRPFRARGGPAGATVREHRHHRLSPAKDAIMIRVLIVDDSATMRALIAGDLRQTRHRGRGPSRDPQQARAAIKELKPGRAHARHRHAGHERRSNSSRSSCGSADAGGDDLDTLTSRGHGGDPTRPRARGASTASSSRARRGPSTTCRKQSGPPRWRRVRPLAERAPRSSTAVPFQRRWTDRGHRRIDRRGRGAHHPSGAASPHNCPPTSSPSTSGPHSPAAWPSGSTAAVPPRSPRRRTARRCARHGSLAPGGRHPPGGKRCRPLALLAPAGEPGKRPLPFGRRPVRVARPRTPARAASA